jgi:hypothetical protein
MILPMIMLLGPIIMIRIHLLGAAQAITSIANLLNVATIFATFLFLDLWECIII